MATQQALFRAIATLLDDQGDSKCADIDTDALDVPLVLTGYKIRSLATITLASDADDQAFTFTAAAAVMLVSQNGESFKVRIADSETLSGELLLWQAVSKGKTTAAYSTSVLLTGNGTNEAVLKAIVVEKVAA